MHKSITCTDCEYYDAIEGTCSKDKTTHYPQHTCDKAKLCNLAKKYYAKQKRDSCPFI